MMQGLESIPTWFADFTDISLEAAQAILSLCIILAVLLPTMYLAKDNRLAVTIVLFLIEIVLVGIGWLSFWVLIATVAVMAIAIAFMGAGVVTGRG